MTRRSAGSRRWATLAVLCVSLLIVSLDNTVLNVALPTLVRDLHASSSGLQWVMDAYAVVFAGLLLVQGSLGDRLGRKWVFLAGLVVFAVGSAASAFSHTTGMLVGARAFMGIGAAAIMPSTLSILTNVFVEPRERARAIGIWSGTTGLGLAVGPIVGGWLLTHFWWGSVFLINVPIAAIGFAAAVWLVPNSRQETTLPPDPLGAVLSIGGMVLLLWGIIEAPNRSWTSPYVLGSIAAGIVVLALFVHWEHRTTHPMLELSFFRSRRFSVAVVAMALVIFSLMGSLFLLTQYLQFDLGYSPLQAGVRITPIAGILLVAAPISSILAERFGTRAVVAVGLGLISIGLFTLARTSTYGTYGTAFPGLALLGLGTGLAFAPSTESIMGSLPPDRAGVGSATNSAGLQIGGALGIGVLGSLLATRYQSHLTPLLARASAPHAVSVLVLGSLGGAQAVAQHLGGTLGAALRTAAVGAFVSGLDLAMVVGGVVVATATVVVAVALPARADATAGGGGPGGSPRGDRGDAEVPEDGLAGVTTPDPLTSEEAPATGGPTELLGP
ncbi:MAG: DHA2 family efflux MFS transporter permease subunit [Actinomycetota bacterium]|nr:DHA2 family efflux MFS transporter permease subunit [Actinomycetota bacterium]